MAVQPPTVGSSLDEQKLFCEIAIISYCPRATLQPQGHTAAPDKLGGKVARMVLEGLC